MLYLGRLLVFHANIELGKKVLPGKNTLAYYENSKIMDVKSFLTFGPGHRLLKLILWLMSQ